jgi:hypothetical protein
MDWRKLGDLAFACLGAAIVWPLVGYAVFGPLHAVRGLLIGLGPSLLLIATAAVLFVRAARR